MNNNVLLSIVLKIVPVLAVGFVSILVIYKICVKIRSKFNITVNCWFCNHNVKVPYLEANSWTCPQCEQYNGFNKDGDYNREIYEQLDCSNVAQSAEHSSLPPAQNGFCEVCNEAQRLKVEKLSQFEPKNESHFDEELKVFKAKLEEQYRLCATCERHLKNVLLEKKKIVLGSKFLDFIIKGAEQLKQSHLNEFRHAQQRDWKKRCRFFILLLTIINLCCLMDSLPTLSQEYVKQSFGESLGHYLFMVLSHGVALVRVLTSYLKLVQQHPIVTKLNLFFRTLFMMAMYSMGLKVTYLNLATLFVNAYPFALLSLAFVHNIADSFHLTRYTFMMLLWSIFASGLVKDQLGISQNALMLISSCLTLILEISSREESSPKLQDNTTNSFHKLYSEDYLSDDESISMLSQRLNNSSVSVRSMPSSRSFNASPRQQTNTTRFSKSPLSSSAFSLNTLPHAQLSPNSTFTSGYCANANGNQPFRRPCASPMGDMPTRSGFFASNLEMANRQRSQSAAFGMNTSTHQNGSAFLNSSFANAPLRNPFQVQHNESFFTAANSSDQFGATAPVHTDLHSPFSMSSNSVYQPLQAPSKVISPTRFGGNYFVGNATSSGSWLSGGYFNQRPFNMEMSRNGHLLTQQHNATSLLDKSPSRASSRSSGFESQNERSNMSRENSCCPEANDTLINNANNLHHNEGPFCGAFSSRPSMFSHLTQPLSVNCSTGAAEQWRASTPTRRTAAEASAMGSFDSFNLRKINEELPTIKQGDLLKKWKEGQTIS